MERFNQGLHGAFVVVAAAAIGLCAGIYAQRSSDDVYIEYLKTARARDSARIQCLNWVNAQSWKDGITAGMYAMICGDKQ
jgi:hypothetical protein